MENIEENSTKNINKKREKHVLFTCQQCGKTEYVIPYVAKIRKYCSNECRYDSRRTDEARKKQSQISLGCKRKPFTKEHCENISKNRKGKGGEKLKEWYQTEEGKEHAKKIGKRNITDLALRKRNSIRQHERVHTQEEKDKIGLATTKRFKDPIFREKHKKAVNETNTIEKRQKISNSLLGCKQSEETKKKRSETYIKKWQDSEYRKKTLKIWRAPTKNTNIEILIRDELIRRDIKFEQQKIFADFHTIPDFYIPDKKMVIYCDGEYWHSPLDRQIKDLKQVEVLRENSYIVFRLKGKDILENPAKCLDNIGLGQIKRLRISIGLPNATDMFHHKFMMSLLSLQFPPHADIRFHVVTKYQLPFARNRIVEEALIDKSDYLLFLDADMVFPPDLLTRLLAHDKDIVNALAFRRTSPHYPCVFKWDKKNSCYETMQYTTGLLEVDACGMNNMLIKTDVFRKLKKPWYYYRDNLFSSDLTACENFRKAGYKVYVDTDQKMGHIGSEQIITEDYYLSHLSPEAKEQWNSNMKESLEQYRAKEKENYV